ncbi:MAG: peptide ABC transporter substrate-binding protein [Firmicutes bacterium]|nr:peptide ABC transporter substrate-binding protein [Bacillota bacterium]
MRKLRLIILIVFLLSACGIEGHDPTSFHMVYSGEVSTLNYLTTASGHEITLAANMVDSLIEYDKYGRVQPALATDWEVSDDGLTWTFHLREGVWWYTWDGEPYAEVVAQDFVDAMRYILTPENNSKTANIAYRVIRHAEDYYSGELEDFSQVGVRAVDRYTLEYTLSQPVPYFLSMLNYVCFYPANGDFLMETGERFGTDNKHLLYNGAYIMTVFDHQSRKVLEKNENYWDRDNVFIERIHAQYNAEAAALAPELFLRGEISFTHIPSMYLDEWMRDPEKRNLVRPGRPGFYSVFYAFNFDPQYDERFGPENWRKAVNNVHFRKSIFHALDRTAAMMTSDPYHPENKIHNTITPEDFIAAHGVDYTSMGNLAQIAETDSFAPDLARLHREKAMEQLAGVVDFPVQVVMPYSTGSYDWIQRAQVVEQQLERLLGRDYINIVLDPHPPTGFLSNTRSAGKYSLQELNWGPDYADPETYTDPFIRGASFNFPEKITETTPWGETLYTVYERMVMAAKTETKNMYRRYELFANAEAYLIDNAFVIPYGRGGGGYIASWLDPFETAHSPFGVASDRFKGRRILPKPMGMDEYQEQLAKWEEERKRALQAE